MQRGVRLKHMTKGPVSWYLRCQHPIAKCWFKGQLFCSQLSSLLRLLERQQKIAQGLGALPPIWEIQKEFLASGISLAQPWLL